MNSRDVQSTISLVDECNPLSETSLGNQAPAVIDLAYSAGVIDTDGYISIQKRMVRDRHRSPTLYYIDIIGVGQVETEAVMLLRSLFGGSIYTRKTIRGRGKDLHIWRVQQQLAGACLTALLPYLRIKKAQALNCLAFRSALEVIKATNRAVRGQAGSLPRSADELATLEGFYLRSQELNSVGRDRSIPAET